MFDLKLLRDVLWPDLPKYPNARLAFSEELLPEGLTMGTLIIGRQGTGKTTALANHLVEYFKKYPDRAIFVLDWSGSITDNILSLIAQEPEWEKLAKRIIYDDLGNPEWVVPLPEFSHLYGTSVDEQAHRVANNLQNLSPELVTGAPFLAGLGLQETAPQLFRMIGSITNEYEESWQVTEARQLLTDTPLLRAKVAKYGFKSEKAQTYFT